MSSANKLSVAAMLATTLMLGTAAISARASSGEELFKLHCTACHSIQKDAPMGMGPNLFGILGRQAGAVQGFPHSNEFKAAMNGKTWTAEMLDKWLENPQKLAKGTFMMYQQPDPAIRAAIIDYLKTVK